MRERLTEKRKTLVMVSGGIDSIGALWLLLNETDDELIIQHIKIKNFENRWEPELSAFTSCTEYMKNSCREFTCLPSITYESGDWQPWIYDNATCAFYGAEIVRHCRADRMVTGRIQTEDSTVRGKILITRALRIFYATLGDYPAEWDMPYRHFEKRDWFDKVPQELIDLTFTCRRPTKQDDGSWKVCGECVSCVRMSEGKTGVEPIHTPDLVSKSELIKKFNQGQLPWPD